MSEFDQLALNRARIILDSHLGVSANGDWMSVNESGTAFMLNVELELFKANPTNEISSFSSWSVIIDFEDDKWGKVQIYPSLEGAAIKATFQHQQYNGGSHDILPVRNGNICTLQYIHGLAISKNAITSEPTHTIEKIVWHVERALEWLTAAANNNLVKDGDYFELPDFNIGKFSRQKGLAYYESETSFATWSDISERSGLAYVSNFNNILIVKRYVDKKNNSLYEPAWGSFIKKLPEKRALWIRLNEIPTLNIWQVPSTMQELVTTLKKQRIDLLDEVKKLISQFNDTAECILMLGIPIPKNVGEKPYRYHWQGMVLSPASNNIKSVSARTVLAINHLQTNKPLPWFVSCENWHPSDLQNRGQIEKSLRSAKILLIGGGALGSIISEQLVRMGIVDMTIVDKELLEAGNLVRHTLTINDIHNPKATALAEHLNKINPSANVKGLTLSAPNCSPEFVEAAKSSTLILDLSADDELMTAFPLVEFQERAIIVSCSLGINANRIFLYADYVRNFNEKSFNTWFQPYREEEHKSAEEEKLPRGVGCWHPIVPAPFNRIEGLSSVAIEIIQQIYQDNSILPISYCHNWYVPNLKLDKTKAA